MHRKKILLLTTLIVLTLGIGILLNKNNDLFKGALVGQSVPVPASCNNLVTKNPDDSNKTLKTAIVLIRDVNLNFKDSDLDKYTKLDSKLGQEEAEYFCNKFAEFKKNIEQKTPLKVEVTKIIDLKETVTRLTKATGSTVINGVQSISQDYKIGPNDLPKLDIKPGDLDLFFAVYDNEELLNIVVPNNPNAKFHAAASTYAPSRNSYGAVPIFVQAKETWISQNNNLSHILAHELTHYFEHVLKEKGEPQISIHSYAKDHLANSLAPNLPSSNWVYSQNSLGKTGYDAEIIFMDFIFNNIIKSGNLWDKLSIRSLAKDLSKNSNRSGGQTLGDKKVKRSSPNIVEVPVFQNKGTYYEIVFTAQSLQNENFKFLGKKNSNSSIGELGNAKSINKEWIVDKITTTHDKNHPIHIQYKTLPHYEEEHSHFVLNIPATELNNAKHIKIWAQEGFKWVNPETSY